MSEKFSGTRAQAESLASMVIEWVDTGKGQWDWRPGLANVIEKRLARFYVVAETSDATKAAEPMREAAAKMAHEIGMNHANKEFEDMSADEISEHAGAIDCAAKISAAIRALPLPPAPKEPGL